MYVMTFLTSLQVLRSDSAVYCPIVRNSVHGCYVAVIQYVAMVIDNRASS